MLSAAEVDAMHAAVERAAEGEREEVMVALVEAGMRGREVILEMK